MQPVMHYCYCPAAGEHAFLCHQQMCWCILQAQDILRRAVANDSTASPDMVRQASHSTGDPARLQRVLGKLLRGARLSTAALCAALPPAAASLAGARRV